MNEALKELYKTKFPGHGYENLGEIGAGGEILTEPAVRFRGTPTNDKSLWEKIKAYLVEGKTIGIPNLVMLGGGIVLIAVIGLTASKGGEK